MDIREVYSHETRRATTWVFIPLSLVLVILGIAYDRRGLVGAIVFAALSLMLLTPAWPAFYPAMSVGLAVLLVVKGKLVHGALILLIGAAVTAKVFRNARREPNSRRL